jgi:preprotein translocase subunit SecD
VIAAAPRAYLAAALLLVSAALAGAETLAVELADASFGFDQRTNEPIVSFRMQPASAQQFGELTARSVGKVLAIKVDGRVLSRPVVREPILGGVGQISGSFTREQARELAVRLKSGAAKLELEVED